MPGNIATDVAIHKSKAILAMSVANELGSGFIRFFDLHDPQLDQPLGYTTLTFTDGDLVGQPVDIQWLGDSLYVLLNRAGQLYIAIFDNLDTAFTYTIQPVERGLASGQLSELSFVVQYGQIIVSTGVQYIVLQDNDGVLDAVYWQDRDGGIDEIFANNGSIFLGSGQGVLDVPTPDLAIVSVTPANNSELTGGETVRVQFNQLINTDSVELANDILLLDAANAPIPQTAYTMEGINTLNGGYVDINFITPLNIVGPISINVTTGMTALAGSNMVQALNLSYTLVDGIRPAIQRVARLVDNLPTQHYFHADGTETAAILGSNFGTDVTQLEVLVGDQLLAPTALTLISDTELQISMPNLFLGAGSASLPVSVVRTGRSITLNGAIVIQPKVLLQDITPISGPPQGGNFVDLYGRGFSHNSVIHFGSTVAGDLRVLSNNHIQVRAPSGSFGYSNVSVSNTLFTGEASAWRKPIFMRVVKPARLTCPRLVTVPARLPPSA